MLANASKNASGWPLGMRVDAAASVAQVRPAGARVDLVRLAVAADDHLVRLLLVPLQRALGAVDLDEQVVLAAVA